MNGTDHQKMPVKNASGSPHGKGSTHRRRPRSSAHGQKTPQANHAQSGRQQAQQQKPPVRKFQGTLPGLPVYKVHEPLPVCIDCGRTIDTIASAIAGQEPGTYRHFDCVIDAIKREERLNENQSVSYIGRGTFAVIEKTEGTPGFTIVKRFAVEEAVAFSGMKKTVEESKK
ncbi:hypothetical protein [Parasphaerochaeta coccoides]|nr:hypothetical protein [Parasphaerochaeta coccoides]